MKITVLAEDRIGDPRCRHEHGLSLLIEHDDSKILLDCGQSDIFKYNATQLEIDLDIIKTVVLSHGHYDHGNGLQHLSGKTIYCHPDCFRQRYIPPNGKYAGLPVTAEQIARTNTLIQTREPHEIAPGIYFLTSVPRHFDYEAKEFPTTLKNGDADELHDDGGLVINSQNGIIVITGCAHSGICNTVEYAKKICENDQVYAVIGGFHLRRLDADLKRVVAYFSDLRPHHLITGHCTCDQAYEVLYRELNELIDIQLLGAGKIFAL